jgi:uncharacterized protein YgfB (UPF0149 family)
MLRRAGVLGDAAEIHGSLCAVLSISGDSGANAWCRDSLQDVDVENAQAPAARSALQELESGTWAALNGSDMEFTLLLPDDEAELADRVEALAGWCQGFLYGVSLAGLTASAGTSAMGAEHLDELIRDLAEIARAGLGSDDDAAEADFAYVELVEFIRAGVQLVFEELENFRVQSTPAAQALH